MLFLYNNFLLLDVEEYPTVGAFYYYHFLRIEAEVINYTYIFKIIFSEF